MPDLAEFRYRGAIVRIKLHNFMTYNDTELRPGPNLNMILGPNGTGKSAVVCSIIVGLAGEVSLTGRGSSPADFVKKDLDDGFTEIELYNDRGANYVVQRTIRITGRSKFKLDHKSEWMINGKSVIQREVGNLTRKLNIKVDNLCQFLPQDSVTQFVKMNTCELLLNTLKAAGDNTLVEDLQKLVDITKDVSDKSKALENLQKSCKENEVNAKRLESEVHQLRVREQLVKEKSICSQKIYYAKYLECKQLCDSVRKECDRMKAELTVVESNTEPFRTAVETHKTEEARIRQSVERTSLEVKARMEEIQKLQDSLSQRKFNCQEEFAKFKSKEEEERNRASTIRFKQQEVDSLECKLTDSRTVDLTKEIDQAEKEAAKLREDRKKCQTERAQTEDSLRIQIQNLDRLKTERIQIEAVKEKKIASLRHKFPEAFRVHEWLSKNRDRFKKQVFLPMMCEINVKDARHSRHIEFSIPRQELCAFVCQTEDDLRTLTRSVRDELKARVNVILAPDKTLQEFEAETSQMADLRPMGVIAYLKDLIEAPEPILRYLCGTFNFHRIPLADADCSEAQLKQLLNICPKFFVGNQSYNVSKSRYDNQSMIVTDHVRDPQFLQYSLDAARLAECINNYARVQKIRDETDKKLQDATREQDRLSEAWQRAVDHWKGFKAQQEEKKRLEILIERGREAIIRLQNDKIDIEAERGKLHRSIDKINRQIALTLEKLIGAAQELVRLKKLYMTNLLLVTVSRRNHNLARKRFNDAKSDFARLLDIIKKKKAELATLKTALEDHERAAEDKVPGFNDGKLDRKTERLFASLTEETIEELTEKREDLIIRIQRIYHDANNTALNEFNRQNEELKDKRFRIGELESSVKHLDASREEIKKIWLPKLEEVIQVIDEHYRMFMQKLNYGGQVKLDFDPSDPNDFLSYGIMILVKYRDNEQLIPLSSTRQSGGERSVATMIYMLALQTKTSVPFRCVDEINQGMDKENERKVFELLVQTADASSSQYFLVSPKLLTDLPFSEKMKIHVVFNGKKLALAWHDRNDTAEADEQAQEEEADDDLEVIVEDASDGDDDDNEDTE